MSDSATFFVRRQGRIEGPWSLNKLRAEVKLRKLGRHHEVSQDGDSWHRAAELEGLFPKVEKRRVVTATSQPETTESEYKLSPDEDQSETKVWYCYINDDQQGPMTLSELTQLVERGQILLDDLIYRDGNEDWLPAEEVPELAAVLNKSTGADHGSGRTEATRLVERTPRGTPSRLAIASMVTAIVLLLPSCIPFVGLLGVVPILMSGYAIYQTPQAKNWGAAYAYTALVLGILQVLLALALIVFAVVGFITHSANS